MKESSIDPYDNNKYQATLVKQSSQKIDTIEEIGVNIHVRLLINILITLKDSGVHVSYNPEIIKFYSEDKEIVFRREINSFFLRHGFIFSSIIAPIDVYTCGVKIGGDENEYFFRAHKDILEPEAANELLKILSLVILESHQSNS